MLFSRAIDSGPFPITRYDYPMFQMTVTCQASQHARPSPERAMNHCGGHGSPNSHHIRDCLSFRTDRITAQVEGAQ